MCNVSRTFLAMVPVTKSKKAFAFVVQVLSCVRLLLTPQTAARQASLSITISQSLPKLMSI